MTVIIINRIIIQLNNKTTLLALLRNILYTENAVINKKASPLEFAILEKGDTFYYLPFLFLSANCSNTIDYYFVASVTMTRSLVCFANLLLTEYPVLTQKKHLL